MSRRPGSALCPFDLQHQPEAGERTVELPRFSFPACISGLYVPTTHVAEFLKRAMLRRMRFGCVMPKHNLPGCPSVSYIAVVSG